MINVIIIAFLEVVVLVKRFFHILRFLALVFFLFLAVVMCFIFNKALDSKINESHKDALNNIKPTEAVYPEESTSGER